MQVQHPAVQAYPDSYAPPRKTPTPPEYLDESADDHVEDEEVENSDTDNESKRKRKADSADSPKTSKNGQPKKRQRTTPEQLEVLEKVYEREKLPGLDLRKELAQKLSMTPRRVQVWFQNKRAKEKRMVGGNDFSDFNTPKNTVFL
uniref:Homeobox domain-containing protein n=1 Tax=Arcella intermedia TaxID=1963864 RepID=A0A6B2LNZ6_9EUKA